MVYHRSVLDVLFVPDAFFERADRLSTQSFNLPNVAEQLLDVSQSNDLCSVFHFFRKRVQEYLSHRFPRVSPVTLS